MCLNWTAVEWICRKQETPERGLCGQKLGFCGFGLKHYLIRMLDPIRFVHLAIELPEQNDGRQRHQDGRDHDSGGEAPPQSVCRHTDFLALWNTFSSLRR